MSNRHYFESGELSVPTQVVHWWCHFLAVQLPLRVVSILGGMIAESVVEYGMAFELDQAYGRKMHTDSHSKDSAYIRKSNLPI